MPILRIVLILATLSAVAVVADLQSWANDQAPGDLIRKSIETFLEQLDAPSLAKRTDAERGLLDLGPDVLTYLPPPELTSSASVREAVKRIRIQLERRAARESAQASHIQWTGDATVAQLLKEFTTQTRNRIELADSARAAATESLHVEFTNQPFWDCVDQICDRLNLEAVFDLRRAVLQLQPRSSRDPLPIVQRTGPVRIAVQSAELRPIVGDSTNRLVRVSAKVTLEPRLRPLFLHFAARDLQALNSSGRRLAPWNAAATYELPVGDAGRDVPVQLDFLLPLDDNSPSLDVRGRLAVQLAAGTERIVFDQTSQAPGTVRRRGGVTVRMRKVNSEAQPDGKLRAAIGVAVSYDTGGPAFESHRTWMYHNAVYLETESARRVDFTDYDTSWQENGTIAVDYRWEQLAAPPTQYRFVYEAPTLILDLPVELKLDGIFITRPKDADPVSKND